MRPKHLKNILYIVAVIGLLWLFQAEAEDPKTSISTGAQPSRIEMTVAENGVQANGKLFFLPTYDAFGNTTGGIQNELLNSILDISNLPIGRDGWLPAIGIQVTDDGSGGKNTCRRWSTKMASSTRTARSHRMMEDLTFPLCL
jgi:hypothetical protein